MAAMPTLRAADAYRQTQVQASTPLELVVLLYDNALRFMASAREAIVRKDIRARRDALARVFAFVGELQGTLDMDRGGEVAVQLDRLYAYVTSRLFDAAMHNDVEAIDDARRVFEVLREGWQTIAAQPPGGSRP